MEYSRLYFWYLLLEMHLRKITLLADFQLRVLPLILSFSFNMPNPFKATATLITFLLFICSCTQSDKDKAPEQHIIDLDKVSAIASKAKKYCQTRSLDTDYFILINLDRQSGLKHFYIWDFAAGNIAESYLVSHGCCDKLGAWTCRIKVL
jgi:hypothetical protein